MSQPYTLYISRTVIFVLAMFIFVVGFSGPATAYIGPGLGLGALGVLAGIVVSVLLAIVAVVWYPLKRLLKSKKGAGNKTQEEQQTVAQAEHEEPENKA